MYLFKLAVGISKMQFDLSLFGTCQEMCFHQYKLQN